jgi:hypothetical protein
MRRNRVRINILRSWNLKFIKRRKTTPMVWSSKRNLGAKDTGNGASELNFKGKGCTG